MNNRKTSILSFALASSFIFASTNSFASEMSALGYESVGEFISKYEKKGHYNHDQLIEIFARTKIKKSVVSQSKNQPEVKLTWKIYKNKVVTKKKIEKGKYFIQENREVLEKAELKYGVPKEIITSIIGIESFYGQYKGEHKAIDAISTLSFEGSKRRRNYFIKELEHFLDYCHENNIYPLEAKSSWAGAFGYPQFMPSSIKAYAIDFNDDGKIDLVNSLDDAIGSVANYLNKNGWIKDNYIAEKVQPNNEQVSLSPFKLNYIVSDLTNKGFQFKRIMRHDKKLKLFKLVNMKDEYWVGYNNFHTITTYNRSNLYAMAVFELANEIKGEEVK